MLKSKLLDDIGRRHGTDKSSEPPRGHDYLRKYEFFLRPFKDSAFTFLELGVWRGASLRVWSEYFSQARIVGVDIEPAVRDFDLGRAEVIIGDLSQNDFLETLVNLTPLIVVDDASHWWPDQFRALFSLYHRLPSGALYVLEDVHTSFKPLDKLFSSGLEWPPFEFLLKMAEYMTGNEKAAPIVKGGLLEPLRKSETFHDEIRFLADLTDAVTFIERACLLIKK